MNELVQSIGRSGWLDFEPMIVLNPDTVIEGNRRLAAIRLLGDEKLRKQLSYRLPAGIDASGPSQVRIHRVDSKAEARAFIGFKHINGAFKWDSYAKARYAHEWLNQEPSTTVAEISERLGDGHSTVLRLINGYRVLSQAEAGGFNIEDVTAKRGFSFSHLYTALPSPSVRKFMGISDPVNAALPESPVPESHVAELQEYMIWLYGQKGHGDPVVRTQNPDLGRLTRVLESPSAIRMLRVSNDLDEAYETVEDKSEVFADAVYAVLKASRDASKNLGFYDGDGEVLNVARQALNSLTRLYRGMQETTEIPNDEAVDVT